MKFAIAVVVLALALGAESHALPWAVPVVPAEGSYVAKTQGAVHVAPLSGHANSAAAINVDSAPGTVPAHGPLPEGEYVAKTQGAVHIAPLAGHAQSVVADNDRAAPGTVNEWVAPVAVPAYAQPAYHAPAVAPVAVAVAPAVQAEGEYVARTQGAVHVAPLAGHANSVASINDDSAPGTSHNWAVPVAPAVVPAAVQAAVVPAYSPAVVPAYSPAVAYSSIAAHGPVVAQAPIIAHAPVVAHTPIVAHAPVVAPVEGSYVAKTRGAVHVAPLAGHAHSAASINLQPAPGTVY